MAKIAHVIDSWGQPGRLKLRRIREHEVKGLGRWEDVTERGEVRQVFVFTRRPESVRVAGISGAPVRHSPAFGPVTDAPAGHDSGQAGFLRYPLATAVSGGLAVRYPALARAAGGV